MIEENKISLLGDAVAHGRVSKILGLLGRIDIGAAVLSGLFLAANIEISAGAKGLSAGSLGTAAAMVGGQLLATGFIKAMERPYVLHPHFSAADRKNKCINTKPRDIEKASLAKWGPVAQDCKQSYIIGMGAALANTVLLAGLYQSAGLSRALAAALLLSTPTAVRSAMGYNRWHKVAKGEWAVEDRGPPPERVKLKAKVPGFLKPAENLG